MPPARSQCEARQRRERLSPLVREVLLRIQSQYERPLTLKAIAGDLGRQTEYLGWIFRRQTGATFHHRLVVVRLRRAARLIRRGEKIDAVVLLVGYRSKKNFYQQFRKQFGMRPAEYRHGRPATPASAPFPVALTSDTPLQRSLASDDIALI